MKYFDANAMIGAHFGPREGRFLEARDLLADMDFFGIDEALVYHGLAKEYDCESGNARLTESLQHYPRLHPGWVIGLHHTTGLPPTKALLQQAKRQGVVGIKFFFDGPLSESTVVDPLAYEKLFAEIEKRRFPLFIEYDANPKISAEQIAQLDPLLNAFPKLPVILTGFGLWGGIALLYARLAAFPNLRIGLTPIVQTNGLLEDLVHKFGAGRILFASQFPWFSLGQAKIALAYARIKDSEREAIAGENLRQLIRRIRK